MDWDRETRVGGETEGHQKRHGDKDRVTEMGTETGTGTEMEGQGCRNRSPIYTAT